MSPGRAITCKHVQELLDDFRRGKLLPGQRQVLGEHIAECADCKAELEQREALSKHLLTALPASSAPAGLSPEVMAAIRSASRSDQPRVGKKSNSLLSIMLATAVIVIAAVAVYQVRTPATLDRQAVISASPEDFQLYVEDSATERDEAKIAAVPAKAQSQIPDSPAREIAAAAPLADSASATQMGLEAASPAPVAAVAAPDTRVEGFPESSPGQEQRSRTLASAEAPAPQESTSRFAAPASAPQGFSRMASTAESFSLDSEAAPPPAEQGRLYSYAGPVSADKVSPVENGTTTWSTVTPTTSTIGTTVSQMQTTDTLTTSPGNAQN